MTMKRTFGLLLGLAAETSATEMLDNALPPVRGVLAHPMNSSGTPVPAAPTVCKNLRRDSRRT